MFTEISNSVIIITQPTDDNFTTTLATLVFLVNLHKFIQVGPITSALCKK